MKIELSKIPNDGLQIDEIITLDKEIYANANIKEIKNLHIKGLINYDYENNLVIDLKAEGIFVIEDALSLDNMDYEFECEINENLSNIETNYKDFYEKSKNTLDISEILWENIVLEIPIRATKLDSDDLTLKGEGWELVNKTVDRIDPRLEKLQELFNEGKE